MSTCRTVCTCVRYVTEERGGGEGGEGSMLDLAPVLQIMVPNARTTISSEQRDLSLGPNTAVTLSSTTWPRRQRDAKKTPKSTKCQR